MAELDRMVKSFGDQLKLPYVDITRLMEQYQKNLEAMAKCWQAMAAGTIDMANRQRAVFEATVCDLSEVMKTQKQGGDPQHLVAAQTALATKALASAMANTREFTEFVQHSSAETMKIVQDRLQESCEAMRESLEKKQDAGAADQPPRTPVVPGRVDRG